MVRSQWLLLKYIQGEPDRAGFPKFNQRLLIYYPGAADVDKYGSGRETSKYFLRDTSAGSFGQTFAFNENIAGLKKFTQTTGFPHFFFLEQPRWNSGGVSR